MSRIFILWRTRSEPKCRSPIPHSLRPSFSLKTLQATLCESRKNQVFLFDSLRQPFNFQAFKECALNYRNAVLIVESGLFGAEEFNNFISQLPERRWFSSIFLTGTGPSWVPEEFLPTLAGENYRIFSQESEHTILAQLGIAASDGAEETFQEFFSAPPITFDAEEIEAYPYYFPIKTSRPLRWGHVLSSRGCPHSCSFCSNVIRETYGTRFRPKSLLILKHELRQLKELGVTAVSFADDNLSSSPTHLRSLCELMISENFGFIWTAHARIDELDPELLRLMKKAGCSLLRFGLESGSVEVLRYFRKSNAPEAWWKDAALTIGFCRELDIQTSGLFILGAPIETPAHLLQTAKSILLSRLDLIQIHFFTPYPDTEEFRRLNLHGKVDSSHYSIFSKNYSRTPSIWLKLSFVMLYLGFYLNPATIIRFLSTYGGYIRYHFPVFLKLNLGLFRIPASFLGLFGRS